MATAAADEDGGGMVEDVLFRTELVLTGLNAERDGVLDVSSSIT